MIFKDVTAPGYFDFSANQTSAMKKFSDAFNLYFDYIEDQEALFTDIFENWKNRDYSSVTVSRTPFVLFQLQSCGLSWFRGNEDQASRLAAFVQAGFNENISLGIYEIFELISSDPFNWAVLNTLQLTSGIQVPAIFSETLAIYSTSVGAPSTPIPSAYVERDWDAPSSWDKHAESATYVSYGTLSGSTITWSTPYDVSSIDYYFRAALSGMPSANAGDVTIIDDDGTDDVSASYFYNGSIWQKFSTEYDKQGLVSEGVPSMPPQSLVVAPDPSEIDGSLSSDTPPPTDGDSKGYGIYAGLSQFVLSSGSINVTVEMTSDGVDNLGVVINLLRRVKPTLNVLLFTYEYLSIETTIDISDTGEV